MDYKGLYYSIMGQIIFVYVAQIVYSILNLVSCYMMSIPTKKNESKAVASNSNNEEQENQLKVKYCKECGTQLDEASKFCPSCGKDV